MMEIQAMEAQEAKLHAQQQAQQADASNAGGSWGAGRPASTNQPVSMAQRLGSQQGAPPAQVQQQQQQQQQQRQAQQRQAQQQQQQQQVARQQAAQQQAAQQAQQQQAAQQARAAKGSQGADDDALWDYDESQDQAAKSGAAGGASRQDTGALPADFVAPEGMSASFAKVRERSECGHP